MCQTRRRPQRIMEIYGQGLQRSLASVLSRMIFSCVGADALGGPMRIRRKQIIIQRFTAGTPRAASPTAYISLSLNNARAHLHRLKVVSKCALVFLPLRYLWQIMLCFPAQAHDSRSSREASLASLRDTRSRPAPYSRGVYPGKGEGVLRSRSHLPLRLPLSRRRLWDS